MDKGSKSRVIYQPTNRLCSVDGCEKPVRCKALCATHYERSRRRGSSCPTCGGQKREASSLCQACWVKSFIPRGPNKICARCKRDLPLEAFGWRLSGQRLRGACRECEAIAAKELRLRQQKRDPEGWQVHKRALAKAYQENLKKDPDRRIRLSLRSSAKKLGLDPDVVSAHYEVIGNHCESCGWAGGVYDGTTRRICIDHDHVTLRFRGFLCSACNFIAGHAEDSPLRLKQVSEYLTRVPPSYAVLPPAPKDYQSHGRDTLTDPYATRP